MKSKPGVMVYFEIRSALKLLSDKDKGILFDAILEYGETGCESSRLKESEFLGVLWPLIKIRIDGDDLRYTKMVVKRKYSAYVRWAKKHGEEPLSFEDWKYQKGLHVYDTLDPEDAEYSELMLAMQLQ